MSAGDESVGDIATLYLGNLLYAIERCAVSLEEEGKPVDAAFYRGSAGSWRTPTGGREFQVRGLGVTHRVTGCESRDS